MQHRGPHRYDEFLGYFSGRLYRFSEENACSGVLVNPVKILVQARELNVTSYLTVNDLGSYAAATHQQTFFDEFLDCPADCRSAQAEALAEGYLVFDPRTGRDDSIANRFF